MKQRDVKLPVKNDRTLLLLSTSLLIFVLSLFLPVLSVHTYCENRSVAVVFGVIALITLLMFFRNHAGSTAKKIAAGVGESLSILASAINLAFIVYATHLCRHMFDGLR